VCWLLFEAPEKWLKHRVAFEYLLRGDGRTMDEGRQMMDDEVLDYFTADSPIPRGPRSVISRKVHRFKKPIVSLFAVC